MNYSRIISSVAIIIIVSINVISSLGCANIVPPQGGPRDSLPPVLEKVYPENLSKNFKDNKITFTFDEFVDVQGVQENMMVSPLPKETPVVDYKLKTVTVKLKDSLEANTTYTIDFGDAVRDVNEANIYKNLSYTFSTGPSIDSFQLAGKILLAETGKADTTLIVMLHTSADDSVVVKEKPRYITKLDGKGNFVFKNLPGKTFYIYGLKDEGNTKRYLSAKQLFAFADKPINISAKNDSVTLYAFAAKKDKLLAVGTGAVPPKRGNSAVDKRLRFTNSLDNKQQDLLGNLIFSFEQPLKNFDSSKLSLFTDSAFTAVIGYSFKKDSTGKKIILQTEWKENTLYQIILDKDFAEDSSGRKLLKTDTLSFTTKKKTDYGTLKIKIRNLDIAKNPVLQILLNGTIIRSMPMASAEFTDTMFPPGEYELQVLLDENKNGQWDPGDFFKNHKQPELVKPIQRKIVVRPIWQNEFEIAL